MASTFRAVACALSADSAVEKEVNIYGSFRYDFRVWVESWLVLWLCRIC